MHTRQYAIGKQFFPSCLRSKRRQHKLYGEHSFRNLIHKTKQDIVDFVYVAHDDRNVNNVPIISSYGPLKVLFNT